jgi:4-hydroxy-3-methylbut-2-en-1-yl diphosphate reductase
VIRRLRERFPNITGPKSDDICYATTNRQMAVRQMARECDLVLVIGSSNSSNSNRLVEVARDHGAESPLIDNETQVREEWLEGKRVVGISSGASAPEELVQRLVEFFRERGTSDVSEFQVVQEDVRFMLPREIRRELAARA